MCKRFLNVLVTGAAGNIAYSLVPIIASGNYSWIGIVFGTETFINFYLYDLKEKEGKL